MLFLRRREWNGAIKPGDADDGAVQIVEGFFVDDGSDFSGEASGAGVLVKDDYLVVFLTVRRWLRDRWARASAGREFYFDIFFGENFGRSRRSGPWRRR